MTERLPRWIDEPLSRIRRLHADGRLAHALLVHAPDGWGAAPLASLLALMLIGEEGRPRYPALDAAAKAHPDLRWLTPIDSGQIKVDQVRALTDFVYRRPQRSPAKVGVVAPADAMNVNAANALLKALEEPAADTFLLLATARLEGILPTIRSRCQLLRIEPAASDEVDAWLLATGELDAARIASLRPEVGDAPLALLAAGPADTALLGQWLDALSENPERLPELAAALAKQDVAVMLTRWLRHVRGAVQAALNEGRGTEALVSFWDDVLEAERWVRGTANPNKELLLVRLLARWRDLGHAPSR